MITSREEYLANLVQINNTNKPTIAILIPGNEPIYNINLNTRKVEVPNFLSVKMDHYAEIIYFQVDRYYDSMDLVNTTCLIQYQNTTVKNAEGHFYLVPFYDITTLADKQKILLPWIISNSAAAEAGNLSFSFRFFQLNENNEYIYSLNTETATSKILKSLDLMGKGPEGTTIETDAATTLAARIDELSKLVGVYWVEV